MDRAVLDTDIFSELLKGRDTIVRGNGQRYREEHGMYTVTTITVAEVVKGLHRRRREDRIRSFVAGLESVEVLTLDVGTAELAGRIYADLEASGRPIGRADPLVAAIAIGHRLVLVTGNSKHYEQIRSLGYPLRLEDWRREP